MSARIRGLDLGTINTALRCIGLVLVVATDDVVPPPAGPVRLWIETRHGYKRRTEGGAS